MMHTSRERLSTVGHRPFMTAVAVLLCFALPSPLRAHAHIFIDYTVEAVFDDGRLQGFEATWTFDRMFSAFIVKQFDADKNGHFDKEETVKVFQGSFMNLKKNDFFTYIKLGHDDLPAPTPTDFTCDLVAGNEMVRYTFFLPLSVDAASDKQRVSVFFFDPVIYVSFTVMEESVTVSNPDSTIETEVDLRRVKYTNRPTITFRKTG